MMSDTLRRCQCGTLNNITINDEHCWSCNTPWSQQDNHHATVSTGQ